jgi:hypothetical protein
MMGRMESQSEGERSASASSPSTYVSGQCIGLSLGESAVLAIKPFDPGEDDVIQWAESLGFMLTTEVLLLSCGYDLILCRPYAT